MTVATVSRSKKSQKALEAEAFVHSLHTGSSPQPVSPVRFENIPLLSIEEDKLNPRKGEESDAAAIESLMQAFQTVGQLQPIRVYENGHDAYLLGYGHRRLMAARRLGWDTIRAEIMPMPADRGEIILARGVENLERANLTVFEEAVMVSQVLDSLKTKELDEAEGGGPDMAGLAADLRREQVERAALKLGRPASWIRDRGYLARLDPKVQKMVLDGLLPLGHARELAKLADKGMQLEGAEQFGAYEAGEPFHALERLKGWVALQMRSLRGVPWNLDIEFANKPACANCPFNTVNDKNLFEHDEAPPEDGLCLNDGCFNAKQKACEGAVKKAVAKMEEKKLEATPGSARTVIPGFLKPARVVREVKRGRGELPKLKPRGYAGDGESGRQAPTARQRIETKWWEIERKWEDAARKAIKKAIVERPMRLVALYLAHETKWGQGLYNANDKTIQKGKFILDWVKASDQEAVNNLLEEALPYFERTAHAEPPMLEDCSTLLMKTIADGWGIQIEPPPDKQTLIAEAEAADKAAAEKAKAKEKSPKADKEKKAKGKGRAKKKAAAGGGDADDGGDFANDDFGDDADE